MPDLSRAGVLRECTAGDSQKAQEGCMFFEVNRNGKCLNQRFGEFCPYYDYFTEKSDANNSH
jgi:hypothetical protein